jgi:hypothetical protein
MRADIHDGPEPNTLQSEAGYIDARPQSRQIDETLLQRTAGPYMWVNRVALSARLRCLLLIASLHFGAAIAARNPVVEFS